MFEILAISKTLNDGRKSLLYNGDQNHVQNQGRCINVFLMNCNIVTMLVG